MKKLEIEEESPEKTTSSGSHQVWRVLHSFIMETERVFSMVYFIVLVLIDCSWTTFVMRS